MARCPISFSLRPRCSSSTAFAFSSQEEAVASKPLVFSQHFWRVSKRLSCITQAVYTCVIIFFIPQTKPPTLQGWRLLSIKKILAHGFCEKFKLLLIREFILSGTESFFHYRDNGSC